jgi:hypothetical protein
MLSSPIAQYSLQRTAPCRAGQGWTKALRNTQWTSSWKSRSGSRSSARRIRYAYQHKSRCPIQDLIGPFVCLDHSIPGGRLYARARPRCEGNNHGSGCALALASTLMLLLALPAMYAVQADDAGTLGLVGHALLTTGLLLTVLVAAPPRSCIRPSPRRPASTRWYSCSASPWCSGCC